MTDSATSRSVWLSGSKPEQPLLALIVKMPAAAVVELAGHAGFDFVMIDTEHGPSDMTELEHHVRAAESAGIGTLVRVSDARSSDILRALDAGADGIVVPHIIDASCVRDAVAMTRYPPLGRRSLAVSTRAGHHGLAGVNGHLESARDRVKLICQIEDAEALERLPEILTVTGLDGIFIGPSDLSASLGRPGQVDDPVVVEAVEMVADAVLACDDLSLCVLAGDEAAAQRLIEGGANMVLVNAPALIAERLVAIAEHLRPSVSRTNI